MFGGDGNDKLAGGDGADVLVGGTVLDSPSGVDAFDGGTGGDIVIARDGVGDATGNAGSNEGDRCITDPGDGVTGCGAALDPEVIALIRVQLAAQNEADSYAAKHDDDASTVKGALDIANRVSDASRV